MLTVPTRSSRMQRLIARKSLVTKPEASPKSCRLAVAIAASRSGTRMMGAYGPNVSQATSSISGLECGGRLRQTSRERLGDRLLDDDPLDRGAALPGVLKRPVGSEPHCLV